MPGCGDSIFAGGGTAETVRGTVEYLEGTEVKRIFVAAYADATIEELRERAAEKVARVHPSREGRFVLSIRIAGG